MTVHREQIVKWERNQQDATVRCLLPTLSQRVSGIIMPIFRRARRVCCRVLAPYNAAPHNRYQPHPAEPAQHTTCSNTRIFLLKMGIMMPETCWESVDNKIPNCCILLVSLSLHNLLTMHGHRNLSFASCIQQLQSHYLEQTGAIQNTVHFQRETPIVKRFPNYYNSLIF